jgi:predicted mannosyl-3-phosphoglycerate phosphatase (HAD superfamily)
MIQPANCDHANCHYKQAAVANYISSLSHELAVMAKRAGLVELSTKLNDCVSEATGLAQKTTPPQATREARSVL